MNARLIALFVLLASASQAAEITRVASSFEPNDPFGMFIDVAFEHTRQRGKIVRESYQGGDSIDVTELRYQMLDTRLQMDLHLGLYKDLEFHFGLPIVFQQERSWNFAMGTGNDNSTIINNCLKANGDLVSPATAMGSSRACTTQQPMFAFDGSKGANSYRSGLGDLTFGLAWAILNQKKDDSAPTWVVSLDYTAPIVEAINPSTPTLSNAQGPLGDKVHKYKFSTAISKRIAFAEPYFQLHYTLPWLGPGYYSNCDNPSADRMGKPENCNTEGWNRESTGMRPAHVGGFVFGAEFNAFEAASRHQKLALDFRAMVTYVSEGRTYNEMSDLLGKLLYTGDYFQLNGQFGIVGHAAEFVHLKGYVQLGYTTEHTLTSENIGKDLDGNGTVDITANPKEISPLFDYRVDRVGRRFRIQEATTLRVFVQASFNF